MLICISTHCTMIYIISLTSLNSHRHFIYCLILQKIKYILTFQTQNSIQIAEGSDSGDSDNQGSTVLECFSFMFLNQACRPVAGVPGFLQFFPCRCLYVYVCVCMCVHACVCVRACVCPCLEAINN